jgi:hypothetical protein
LAKDIKKSASKVSFEIDKIATYIGLLVAFVTVMVYIADIKERTAKLECKCHKVKKLRKQLKELLQVKEGNENK